ncbi:Adenine phosphoribosyltransferase [Chelonia mydas]|uniref:adenine phosphoribosyltransferase n=1 Tax=Chelonia mydas TaxID=8469 RepID=M7CAW7_CHEMY|nr:Adenine phosphoribosyltransferase [Chelonia mydas]
MEPRPWLIPGTWARARASPPLEHSAPALASQPGSRDVRSRGLLAGRGSRQLGAYSPGIGSPGTIHAHGPEDCGAYGEPREPEAEMFKQLPAAQSGAAAAADQGLSLPAEEEILAVGSGAKCRPSRGAALCSIVELPEGPGAAPGDSMTIGGSRGMYGTLWMGLPAGKDWGAGKRRGIDEDQGLQDCIADLLQPFCEDPIDLVAGIDAMGFILGAAIANTLQKGFLAIRKAGHLCVETCTQPYTDYTARQKRLEMRMDTIQPGLRVLLVDQWIETGGTMRAAIQLVEQQGGVIAGIAAICIEDSDGGKWIQEHYKCSQCVPPHLMPQFNGHQLESFQAFGATPGQA